MLEALFLHLLLCHVFRVTAEDYVRSASRHVGRDRDRALASRLGDYGRFFFMIFRVQNIVLDPLAFQHFAEYLGFFDSDRADKNGLTLRVNFLDALDNGFELARLAFIDLVVKVFSDHRLVRRDLNNVEPVDLPELVFLGQRGTRHTGKFLVKSEKILESDRRKRF